MAKAVMLILNLTSQTSNPQTSDVPGGSRYNDYSNTAYEQKETWAAAREVEAWHMARAVMRPGIARIVSRDPTWFWGSGFRVKGLQLYRADKKPPIPLGPP